ncbi:MFS transporter [Rhodovarius lipocyclicus]|uniref:MFS transporter n=1 Tax=Rhodovarius lipocyclicus TaxID=268410 RepID=UPI00135852B6|nr:MFS transporter [Rhodovarius lipocyclicus]
MRQFAPSAAAAYHTAGLIVFFSLGAAPTPVYRLYQEAWGFSPLTLTLVFGIYALALLGALLTLGGIGDHIGRRPAIALALGLQVVSLSLFLCAEGVGGLLAARAVQGMATGIAGSSFGAALMDSSPARGPTINTVAPLLGLTLGVLLAGLLVQFAPWPMRLVFLVLLLACLGLLLLLPRVPETVRHPRRPPLRALLPRIAVPEAARLPLLLSAPLVVAVWATGGLYLSLMPSLLRAATGSASSLTGAGAVTMLTLSGLGGTLVARHLGTGQVLRLGALCLGLGPLVVLAGVFWASLPVIVLGSAVAGLGFGGGFLGVTRWVLPLGGAEGRAGLLSALYVISYLAFCIPAMAGGVAAGHVGLVPAACAYLLGLAALGGGALAVAARR